MKSFQQFNNPSYEDIKLDLPKVHMNEASIMKPDYVIGHSVIWNGTNKIISGIFEPYEKVTIVKSAGNPDAFYADEDGEYEKFFKGQNSGKFLHIKSNSLAPLSSSWVHYKEDGSPPAGAQWEDLIVVETNDAVLISNKYQTQLVKNIVQTLKDNKISEGQQHTKVNRPWGHYLSIVRDSRWQVKLISVNPGGQLSLQMHHHRSEHWVVVKGTAKVEIDQKLSILSENESIYIPLGSKHRLSNPGKIKLILIEVQSGSYLGEDDIHRFEDNYGRIYNK